MQNKKKRPIFDIVKRLQTKQNLNIMANSTEKKVYYTIENDFFGYITNYNGDALKFDNILEANIELMQWIKEDIKENKENACCFTYTKSKWQIHAIYENIVDDYGNNKCEKVLSIANTKLLKHL